MYLPVVQQHNHCPVRESVILFPYKASYGHFVPPVVSCSQTAIILLPPDD